MDSKEGLVFYSRDNYLEQINSWRKEAYKITFTNGCFDILHAGHVTYLTEAKALADKLVLGLNSDTSVTKLKGVGRPINSQVDRAIVLSNLKMVDMVIIFDEDTPIRLIEKINPDYLVKGGDYKIEDIVGGNFVKSQGNQVLVLSEKKGYSTTKIIADMKRLK